MPIRDLDHADTADAKISAQICIVGAGIAGFALASRLAESGRRVLVLESGSASHDDGVAAELNRVADAGGRYSRAETNRARGIGGTSRIWGGRMIPLQHFQMRPRDYLHEPGWPIPPQSLDPFAADAETIFGLEQGGGYEEERNACPPHAPSPGVLVRWAKVSRFGQRNLANAWRRLAGRKNVDVFSSATVTNMIVSRENGSVEKIVALSPGGNRLEVVSQHVVLAVGAIEAARMLLWFRMALGESTFGGDSLGRYFQDHLRIGAATIRPTDTRRSNAAFNYRIRAKTLRALHLETDEKSQREDQVYGAYAYPQMELENNHLDPLRTLAKQVQSGRPDATAVLNFARNLVPAARSLTALYLNGHLDSPPNTTFQLMVCVEQKPDFDNQIALAETVDRFGVPKARLSWRVGVEEHRAFASMIKRLDSFWKQQEYSNFARLEWKPALISDPLNMASGAMDAAHPSGVTRMGLHRNDSVVSTNLTLHDSRNLSVVSTAVFPIAGSANPTLTLMKLAIQHADYLTECYPNTEG